MSNPNGCSGADCFPGFPAGDVSAIPAMKPRPWILPPLSNSWIIFIIWLHIARNRTPNINCYWVG